MVELMKMYLILLCFLDGPWMIHFKNLRIHIMVMEIQGEGGGGSHLKWVSTAKWLGNVKMYGWSALFGVRSEM